jgi:hypothetical protein
MDNRVLYSKLQAPKEGSAEALQVKQLPYRELIGYTALDIKWYKTGHYICSHNVGEILRKSCTSALAGSTSDSGLSKTN